MNRMLLGNVATLMVGSVSADVAVSATTSQADASQHFHATKRGDLYTIEAGKQRYQIPEAFVLGS